MENQARLRVASYIIVFLCGCIDMVKKFVHENHASVCFTCFKSCNTQALLNVCLSFTIFTPAPIRRRCPMCSSPQAEVIEFTAIINHPKGQSGRILSWCTFLIPVDRFCGIEELQNYQEVCHGKMTWILAAFLRNEHWWSAISNSIHGPVRNLHPGRIHKRWCFQNTGTHK